MQIPGTTIEITDGEPSEFILVVAKNQPRFAIWCRAHEINRNSPNVRFVWRTDQLRGVSNAWVVDLGLLSPVTSENRGFYESLNALILMGKLKPVQAL